MGRADAHISASATQIYPCPSESPPHSSHTTHSDQLRPVAAGSEHEFEDNGDSVRRIRFLDISRLALTVLGIGAVIVVVGCEAHSLSVYKSTRLDNGFFLPTLWPENLDLRPTQGIIVGGAVAALMGLVYVVIGVVPVPVRYNLVVILSSISLSIVAIAGSVFGVAYSASVTSGPGYDRENIQSWTCRWVDGAANTNKLFADGLGGITAPKGFKRVCMETHVGFSLLAILICLETLVLVLTGFCAWMEVRLRRSERDLAGCAFGEKDARGRRFY